MRSDIFTNEHGLDHILSETERLGIFCGLTSASAKKLRLLAEEMTGLTVRLFDNVEYEFYIEGTDGRFTLCLNAKTIVGLDQKEKMLSLSSDGRNTAEKGVLGTLSGIFREMLMEPGRAAAELPILYYGMGDMMPFSLVVYREALNYEDAKDQWDGLEKSIIATLASDVTIGVKNKQVEMRAVIDL